MRHGWEGIFGVGLIIKDGGVQVDIEKNLPGREEVGDGVKVCWQSIL